MALRQRLSSLFRDKPATATIRKEPTLGRRRITSQRIETAWDGARVDNLVAGWITTPVPINQQIERELRIVRARSRQLAKNDPYVRRFMKLSRTNVIGPRGMRLRSLVNRANGNTDKPARDAIESAWRRALRPGVLCWQNKHSGLDFFNLAHDSLMRDGEAIILDYTGVDQGEFGIKFRLVDPELLDVNHRDMHGKRKVRMGIETDDRGRVVAYHFHSTDTTHEHFYRFAGKGYLRIPAEFVIHVFVTEYVDQLRGFPHTAAAMMRLRMLNGYEEAEIVGARGAAASMGFVIRGENDKGFEGEQTIVTEGDDDDDALIEPNGERSSTEVIEAEAGTFHYLDHGAEVQTYQVNRPNSAYKEFIKAVLRAISSGLGISYNVLANDLEGVNYSSMRGGTQEDREAWKAMQEFFIEHLLTPVFLRWLRAALLKGAITLPRGVPLMASNLARYAEHAFQGRRWPWVDPAKDMQANVQAIAQRLRSRSDIIREMGNDPEDVWDEIENEEKLLAEKKIKPASIDASAKPPPPDADDDDDDDDGKPAKKEDEA